MSLSSLSLSQTYVLASRVKQKLYKDITKNDASLRMIILQANMLDRLVYYLKTEADKKMIDKIGLAELKKSNSKSGSELITSTSNSYSSIIQIASQRESSHTEESWLRNIEEEDASYDEDHCKGYDNDDNDYDADDDDDDDDDEEKYDKETDDIASDADSYVSRQEENDENGGDYSTRSSNSDSDSDEYDYFYNDIEQGQSDSCSDSDSNSENYVDATDGNDQMDDLYDTDESHSDSELDSHVATFIPHVTITQLHGKPIPQFVRSSSYFFDD